MINTLTKETLGEFFKFIIPSYGPLLQRGHSGKSLKQLVTAHPRARAEKWANAYSFVRLLAWFSMISSLSLTQFWHFFLPRRWFCSRWTHVSLLTATSTYMSIGQPNVGNPSQRLSFQVTPGYVKLTKLTTTAPIT